MYEQLRAGPGAGGARRGIGYRARPTGRFDGYCCLFTSLTGGVRASSDAAQTCFASTYVTQGRPRGYRLSVEPSARVAKAIDDALSAVAKNAPTSVIVRAALRVATVRQDVLAEFWLRVEIHGIRAEDEIRERGKDLLSRLTALIGAEEATRRWSSTFEAVVARRTVTIDGKPMIMSSGVAELELNLESLRIIHDTPITPGMTPLDTGLASLDRDKARTTLGPVLFERGSMLERIKDAAYTYVLEAEAQLIAGETVPDIIAQGRAFVEAELTRRSPDALEAIHAAESRHGESERESASHAATSCRRAIKALADSLYPPGPPITGEDGVPRVMDDDHYRNRLTAWVLERRGRSTHADLLASNLATLGTRLKSLDDLASKGVHADLSRAEVQSCISWVYMLAADLLRIDVQSDSADVHAEEADQGD